MLEHAIAGQARHLVLGLVGHGVRRLRQQPRPVTEDAVLRPDVDFVYARQLATVEALADRWRRAAPDRTVTVLRPVVAMAADGTSSLARALAAGFGQRFGEDDPPAQFVHLDDLASAVVLAVDQRLDGVFNVAPTGGCPVNGACADGRSATHPPPRSGSRGRLRRALAFQAGPIPPGLRSYTREPWLGGQRPLKAHGWSADGHQRAGVRGGDRGRWWTMITRSAVRS
jgi:nucleoside-diphosphate-sugar epimerase